MSSNENNTAAVIVAGGKGIRFGGDTRKQFLHICGHPVFIWTISAFDKSDIITEIVVVVPGEETDNVRTEIETKYNFVKPVLVTSGGKRRQDSVLAGLRQIENRFVFAAVHDGVRCGISSESIENVCSKAHESGAALLAVRATDSTFMENDGSIAEYVDRSTLWNAQTPQVFRTIKLIEAHEKALKEGVDASDDGFVYRRYIGEVSIVEGDAANIKLTHERDRKILEEILSGRTL